MTSSIFKIIFTICKKSELEYKSVARHIMHHLSGEKHLRFLGLQSLKYSLLTHVVGSTIHAVDSQEGLALLELRSLNSSKRLDGWQATIFCKSQGNGIQSICKRAHGVLLQSNNVVRFAEHAKRARDFSSTAAVNDVVVADKIANNA